MAAASVRRRPRRQPRDSPSPKPSALRACCKKWVWPPDARGQTPFLQQALNAARARSGFGHASRLDLTTMKQLSLEAFVDACGGGGPLQLDVTPPDGRGPVRQVLHQPFALLGRHERADVCLQDAGVSRRHALVQMIAGRFYCLDLGSRSGTHWDGEGHAHRWISRKAPFRVGPYRLWLAGESPDYLPAAPNSLDPCA